MTTMDSPQSHQETGEVHAAIIQHLLLTGVCPTTSQLASDLQKTVGDVSSLLLSLEQTHGIVLHPDRPEPWVIHPFSTTPTINWVDAGTRNWWAPCIWCALGIAALASGWVEIHTRIGAEGESLVIGVEGGHPACKHDDLVVHFSIPPKDAWKNVHRHCALVLPFRNDEDVDRWCEAHGQTKGEVVPIRRVAHLARLWYHKHTSKTWRKWNVVQAQEIFRTVGLTSEFWKLDGDGTY